MTLELRKAPKGNPLHPLDERANRSEEEQETIRGIVSLTNAMVRARIEHPFRVIKRQFDHLKTRYRGLAKNSAQLFTLFALGTLFRVRRRLMA